MNQLELKANTWNQQQARENACEQVTIGSGFAVLAEKVTPREFY